MQNLVQNLAALLFCTALTATTECWAQQEFVADEERVEALFIWQFLQYTEWPHSPDAFTVGVMGSTRIALYLEELSRTKRLPDGTVVTIRYFTNADEADKYRAIYLAPSVDSTRLSQALSRIRNKPVLSIGHDERFTERGGIINLFNDKDRLRFEIHLAEATNSKLTLNSKLLRLGKIYNR